MFRKYEKTFRLVIPEIQVKGKLTLNKNEVKSLLGGNVSIEEKLDGANVGIIKHKNGFHLQKRGSLVGQSEHAQYQYFHNWAHYQNYNKLMELPNKYIVYGELLYVIHSIYYDKLPDYFIVFDVWDGTKFLNYKERTKFCDKYGFKQAPLIAEGVFTLKEIYKLIPANSAYGDTCEGIVIKRYRKKDYIRGKIVKPEFIKFMEESEHWFHKEIKTNKLAA